MDLDTKYRAFSVLKHLLEAEQGLEMARHALIAARLDIGAHPGLSVLLPEIERMTSALYADMISVLEGGDMGAWDIRALALKVRTLADNTHGQDV